MGYEREERNVFKNVYVISNVILSRNKHALQIKNILNMAIFSRNKKH